MVTNREKYEGLARCLLDDSGRFHGELPEDMLYRYGGVPNHRVDEKDVPQMRAFITGLMWMGHILAVKEVASWAGFEDIREETFSGFVKEVMARIRLLRTKADAPRHPTLSKCAKELREALGSNFDWDRCLNEVRAMVRQRNVDMMSGQRIEELESQVSKLLEERNEATKADESALAKARQEGERKGWEECMGNLAMAVAMDHGLIENRRQEANRAIIAVKEAEAKVASGEAYYDFLKFRAPEGIKIGYGDSDSSKKEGK